MKKCKDCKKKISPTATRCRSCAQTERMKIPENTPMFGKKRPDMIGELNPNYKKIKQTKEEKLEKARKYRKEHKIYLKHYLRKYLLTANGIYSHLKYESKRRKIKILFTKKEFEHWYNKQEQICYYCARTVKEIINDKKERINVKFRLSIDRKNNKKGYTINNIVLACYRCNCIKSEYFTAKEMLKIGKILYK